MSKTFDPADAGCWLARGRKPHHAEAIAAAWRQFPDLPASTPLEDRMARSRARVDLLRPLHEAMTQEAELERRAKNFAFVAGQIAAGSTDPRHAATLRARDEHGYDWNEAIAYADGEYAARAGWAPHRLADRHDDRNNSRQSAYDHGFRNGGGRPDDLFDIARRSYLATQPPDQPVAVPSARPHPRHWPLPTDRPLPVSWHRRLLLIGASEQRTGALGLLSLLSERPGHETATVLIVAADGRIAQSLSAATTILSPDGLRQLLADREFGDALIAVDDDELVAMDRIASLLPITRTMERLRNSALQRRAQFRVWLARGRAPGEQFAAGHIRWSKLAAGLSGRLGDFTGRYAGPAPRRGHRIQISDATGEPATGYRTAAGAMLETEIIIGNKARARQAITDQLRLFAAALHLG